MHHKSHTKLLFASKFSFLFPYLEKPLKIVTIFLRLRGRATVCPGFRASVSPYGICCGESDTETGFSPNSYMFWG
jgi:hypothetical protein